MLSPEVLNFSPPRATFQVEHIARDKLNSKVDAGKLGLVFKTVTIVAPGVEHLPDSVVNVFKQRRVYRVKQIPVHAFVEESFLNHFVRKGEIVGSSVGDWSDYGNSAKLEDGVLKLSVTRETYEELGLTGKPKLIVNRVASLFEIIINLSDLAFTPSSKMYQRVLWCLKDRLNLTYDWIISWNPHDENVCSSSLAAYWDYHGFSVQECRDNVRQSCLKQLHVPKLAGSGSEDFYDLLEWIGTASLQIHCANEESYESSLTVPEPFSVIGETSVASCNGIFSKTDMSALLDQLVVLLEDEPENMSWVNITFHDLEHGLVSVFLTPEMSVVCKLYRPTNKIK